MALLRSSLAALLLLSISCSGTSAYAGRQRAVRTAPQAWNHEWARGAVFYEIFVRSFADSNGDGAGDFDGLTSKLDYLDQLGIDGIWLMPIFESTSYHGYDTVDYEKIEADFGTNESFKRFLDEAHKRDIRVIIDFVMNHTSVEHPWFADSASSTTSPKRDWYVWSATNPGWRQPWGGNDPSWHPRNGAWYYGAFWSGMPDLNFRNAEAKAEIFRLGRYWLTEGVDGYRLDATRYLVENGPGEAGQADTPETHQVLKEFSNEVRTVRPDAILVAENTVDTRTLASYYGSIPMNFNFPLASAVVDSVRSGNAVRIRDTLRAMKLLYPPGIIDTPFLTNHDQTRVATVLGNDRGKLRNAAAILLTLPGTPFLYYGEEVGLQNGPTPADESKRTPMPWTASGGFSSGTPWVAYAPGLASENVASQSSDPNSLLSYYRNWIGARKQSQALMKGELELVESGLQVLAFTRHSSSERVVVVHNLGNLPTTVSLSVGTAVFEVVHADSGVTNTGATFSLPAHSSGVWRIR